MSIPDYLRPKSSRFKRFVGAAYVLVSFLLAYIAWDILGAGFEGSFGLDGNELGEKSRSELRGSAWLIVLPGILIVMFLVLGLRMLVTGRVGGEPTA